MKTTEPNIPKIPVKIIRKDDKIKITIDKFSLTLNPLPDLSQTYDFVTLEQFITNTAKLIYEDIVKVTAKKVEQENAAKQFKEKFMSAAEENTEHNLIDMELKKRELER